MVIGCSYLVIFKTTLFLADLRPVESNLSRQTGAVRTALAGFHGELANWKKRNYVRMKIKGQVPFLPASIALGVSRSPIDLNLHFQPAHYGTYRYRLLDDGESKSGNLDTRKNRDKLGLLLDSIRHLFEILLSAQNVPLQRELPPGERGKFTYQRAFGTWSRLEPQADVDQMIFWVREDHEANPGQLDYVDTTGRDIAPFTKARIVLTYGKQRAGFILPKRATVYSSDGSTLIQQWELIELSFEKTEL